MATPEPERNALRPSFIAGRGFSVSRKGYDVEEVHSFLREVAEYVSRLQGEVEWLRARGEHLERRSAAAQEAAYGRLSRDFMEVVRRADEAAGRVRFQAETKAQADMVAARKEAERLLSDARLEAERILSAARLEANETIWQAKQSGAHLGSQSEPGWTALPDMANVDLPTMSMDIAAIWDQDVLSGGDADAPAPQLFEEPAYPVKQVPDVGRSNGQAHPGGGPDDAANDLGDPGDLDVHLDVSIFDLFEDDPGG